MDISNIRETERNAVFLAALAGIIANPTFFGPVMQGAPSAAVEFASEVVRVAFGDAPEDPF